MPNTFTPPGIEPGPFGTLTDDATHLAIQPSPLANQACYFELDMSHANSYSTLRDCLPAVGGVQESVVKLVLSPVKWVMIAKDDQRVPRVHLEDICSCERVLSLDTTEP